MSPVLSDGFGGYAVLLAIIVFAHEPWRWLGFLLGRNLSADSDAFLWVRSVATALVAGLVMKLVIFPAGMLTTVPLWARLLALVGGVTLYALGRNLAIGVAGGAGLIALFARAGW